ncbi:MAG: ankyrin repeat domain-containing protein [Rickettsiales bacterium]|nr:ankyrin repeat domain-containing protein [Rickettsiales bacterium]
MIKTYAITIIVFLSSIAVGLAQSSIDVESLGLDDVNKEKALPAIPVIPINKGQKETPVEKKEIKLPQIPIISDGEDVIKKEEGKKEQQKEKMIEQSEAIKEKPIIQTPIIKTKSGKIIEANQAVIPQKEEEPKEIIKTEEEIAAEEVGQRRKEELEKLREKYLIKRDEDYQYILGEKIILPQRKIVNPFISEEIPAPPILESYRTRDNTHIPVFLSLDTRIEKLFETISYGDVALFNSAYLDVKNPNIKNELGDTLLTYSLLKQKHAITASLISKGADVNMANNLGYTPMDIAIELMDFKAFEILAKNNANIYFTDKFGRTYLFHASRLGFLSAVQLLIRRGVDVNILDKKGLSALDIAYKNRQELVVQYLLKNGAKTWNEKPFDPTNSSLIKKLENRWDPIKNSQNLQY